MAINFTLLFIPCILFSYLFKYVQQCVQSTLHAAGIYTGYVQILELLYVYCAYFWESLDTFLALLWSRCDKMFSSYPQILGASMLKWSKPYQVPTDIGHHHTILGCGVCVCAHACVPASKHLTYLKLLRREGCFDGWLTGQYSGWLVWKKHGRMCVCLCDQCWWFRTTLTWMLEMACLQSTELQPNYGGSLITFNDNSKNFEGE